MESMASETNATSASTAPSTARDETGHERDQLSLWFKAAQVEEAFTRSKWEQTLQASKIVALCLVLFSLPDVVRFSMMWASGRIDDDSPGHASGLWGRMYAVFMMYQTALGCVMLVACYLQRSGQVTERGQVTATRLLERAWITWLVSVTAYVFFIVSHPVSLESECFGTQVIEQTFCLNSRLLLKTKMALVLDLVVTVSHACLPIRWFVMVPFDMMVIVGFAAVMFRDPQRAPKNLNEINIVVPMMFIALVVIAAIDKRYREKNERSQFVTIATERVKRVQAEFSAEVGRPTDRRPADGSIHTSAPTTTGTALVFKRFAEGAPEARDDLIDLATREHWMIRQDELELMPRQVLGEGSFGRVITGRFCCTHVAVKISRNAPDSDFSANEVRILRHVHHPNIALFHGLCIPEESATIYVVMERISGVTMTEFIAMLGEDSHAVPEAEDFKRRSCIVRGVVQALAYLHSRTPAIIHSDLKASNVMVEMCNMEPRSKLLDFGLSSVVTRHTVLRSGAKVYAAPELAEAGGDRRAKPSADVWSLGKLMVFVAHGKRPKPGPSRRRDWQPVNALLQGWQDVVMECLCVDSDGRPSAAEVHEMLFESHGSGRDPKVMAL